MNSGASAEYVYCTSASINLFTQDSFNYTVTDSHGHSAGGNVLVTINVISSE